MAESLASQPVKPPTRIPSIVRRLGPGMIIAGSIVGSGELIATTKTGAEAGFSLLWLVLIGCVIKVFVQVELGRYTLIEGKTTMEGLNQVPGPRWRVNWILWFWLAMFVVSIAQLGGVVGGVGQALAIAQPLTTSGADFNQFQDLRTKQEVIDALELESISPELRERLNSEFEVLRGQGSEESGRVLKEPPESTDDVYWAVIITVLTTLLLVVGRYGLVQTISTMLVATFTLITILNLFQLQSLPAWRISASELINGLAFRLPETAVGSPIAALSTALAAFGIIGVGATELIQYPYWCLEKGYARWTGPREASEAWLGRAKGWLRVLQWDAWCSAVVYTFATVVFYLLGAAVLGRVGLNPEGTRMIRTLSEMFVPVFGGIAQAIFLFGAIAVLYSTFFVAIAGHARVCADAVRVFGFSSGSEKANRFWVLVFSAIFPTVSLLFYVFIRAPVSLILASGVMQAIMLPMLGAGALFFRYRRIDPRLQPGPVWDILLWISFLGLFIAGAWVAITKLLPALSG